MESTDVQEVAAEAEKSARKKERRRRRREKRRRGRGREKARRGRNYMAGSPLVLGAMGAVAEDVPWTWALRDSRTVATSSGVRVTRPCASASPSRRLRSMWAWKAAFIFALASTMRSATAHCEARASWSNFCLTRPSMAWASVALMISSTDVKSVDASVSSGCSSSAVKSSTGSSVAPKARHCMTSSSDVTSRRARCERKHTRCVAGSGSPSSGRAAYVT
mmetsp:Transcript_10911/g.32767  ORF Transcript_10911/g.32767 Transcript_10911/m.32767 type:complete len:220 (-) Transcript_10911:202-861(-)